VIKKREREEGSSVLATECAAFLDGTLAEYWDEKGTTVPVWAWTNMLAHGDENLIVQSVVHPNRPRHMARSWRIARSYLAYELLDLTDDDKTLAELQADVLVPLELEMASRPEVADWSPRQWVDAVDIAIRNRQSTSAFGG
jgi:hypothetical protein